MTGPRALALTWVGFVLLIVLVNIVAPPAFGPLALGTIFEPYVVVTGLVAGVFGIRVPGLTSRALVLCLVAVSAGRYLPAWISLPMQTRIDTVSVSTLNIHAGKDAAARAFEGISASRAQLVALQELSADVAAALTPEATGYQYSAFRSGRSFPDVGLLSEYPIIDTQTSTSPPYLRAVIALPASQALVVYVVHAPLGRFVMLGDVPVGVDLSLRDPAIAAIRSRVDGDLAQGHSLMVLGDFNMTEREPAYGMISARLRDAHLDAGLGPGFTWRPSPVTALPFGMLRIDYVLTTADLIPTSSTVDCTLPSDHCRLDVHLVMNGTL